MTQDQLGDLLARVSSGIDEVDFVDTAWAGARRRQQRRRRGFVAVVGGAAAAAFVITSLPGHGGNATPGQPRPNSNTSRLSTTTGTSTDWKAQPKTLSDGTTYVVGPTPDQIAGLTEMRPGLPPIVGWTGSPRPFGAVVADATSAGSSVHVVAVMASAIPGDLFLPMLLLQDDKTRTQSYAVVQATVTAVNHTTVMGAPNAPIDLRAVSPDGTKVAIVQDTNVLVIDVRAGTVNRFPLPAAARPDEVPTGGGFTDAGQIVVTSVTRPLSVSPTTGAVTHLLAGAEPDPVLLTDTGGQLALATTHPDGNADTSTRLSLGLSSLWGQSTANFGWVARGGFPPQDLEPTARPSLNGLFVVARDRSQRVILTIDDGMDTTKGAIRALGWVDYDALFTYSNNGSTWVLGFDPRSNKVYRVSQVLPTVVGVGQPGPTMAIWLGNPRY